MYFLTFSGNDLKKGPHTLTGDTIVPYTPPTDTGKNKCNLHGKQSQSIISDETYEFMIFPQNERRRVTPRKSGEEIKKEPLTRFLTDNNLASKPEDKVEFPLKDKTSGQGDIKVM